MVTKIGRLTRWLPILPGDALTLVGKPRMVRIEFNTSEKVPIMIAQEGVAGLVLLGAPDGYQQFEFFANGDVELLPTAESDVFYRTDDGDYTALHLNNVKPFVKMMEARPRDLAQERIAFFMEQNRNKRAEQMQDSANATLARATAMLAKLEKSENDKIVGANPDGAPAPAASVPASEAPRVEPAVVAAVVPAAVPAA